MHGRLKAHWTPEDAVTRPILKDIELEVMVKRSLRMNADFRNILCIPTQTQVLSFVFPKFLPAFQVIRTMESAVGIARFAWH
jgi:hypothetical protein